MQIYHETPDRATTRDLKAGSSHPKLHQILPGIEHTRLWQSRGESVQHTSPCAVF